VKKIVIIALVVILGLMIVLLIARPGGQSLSADNPPGFVHALRELAPHQDVVANDVAGQACWNDAGQFVAAPGEDCVTRLPEGADRMRICLEQGELAGLVIVGDKYGPQKHDKNSIRCDSAGGGQTFDLYDDNSKLTVICKDPCVLRLDER
jgi:hypothetical protein